MTDRCWECELCRATHHLDGLPYVCRCPARGRLDLRIGAGPAGPPTRAGDRPRTGVWRYAGVLPLSDRDLPATRTVGASFPAGGTPLQRADRLARESGVAELWIKNEAANPTGSLKDRASALVAAAALRHRVPVVAAASTGNAAVSMAGACAAVGLPFVAFLPARAPAARCDQLRGYGATVVTVAGDYATATTLSFAACDEFGWYCRTSAVNPYTTQGKKTAALEILEQLDWVVPDAVVVPVGDGNILVGLHRGFRDAYALGWVDRLPRLIGVQAAGAPAVHDAWSRGAGDVAAMPADTVAGGIGVESPLDGYRALGAVRDTGGAVVVVTDPAIRAARDRLARRAGVAADLAAAATVAALPRLREDGLLAATDRVVLVITGGPGPQVRSGDPPDPPRIAPDLASVVDAVGDLPRGAPRTSGLLSAVRGT